MNYSFNEKMNDNCVNNSNYYIIPKNKYELQGNHNLNIS